MLVVGYLLLMESSTYLTFVVAVLCVGAGAGFYFIPSRSLLTELFVENRGRTFGLQGSAGALGSALEATLSVSALAAATWRLVLIPVVTVLLLVAVHMGIREPYHLARTQFDVRRTFATVYRTPGMKAYLTTYLLWSFTYQAFVTFLPTFLIVEKTLSPANASGAFALQYVVGTVVGPLAGAVGDRRSHLPVAVGGLAVGTTGFGWLLAASSLVAIVGSIVVFAVEMRSFTPVMHAYLMGRFSEGNVGRNFGAVRTTCMAIGSLGPAYVGFVSEASTYWVVFAGLVGALTLSTAVLIYLVLSE